MPSAIPELVHDEAALDEAMTRPSPELIACLAGLRGRLLILGAGGKMGPSLAVMAVRALAAAGNTAEVVAVSRFTAPQTRNWLEAGGVSTIATDLLAPGVIEALPDAPNLIFMVGRKFGTQENPGTTWLTNAVLPARVAERFAQSRIVALSTGNVYPLTSVAGPGSRESDPLTPVGEYSMSCVARERVFDYYARRHRTPTLQVRLSYALDLRYGVLVDIATRVYREEPVDVTMGYVNCIWQGDANEMILRSMALVTSPATAINLTGVSHISVRALAQRFGDLFGRPARCAGVESDTAYLSDMSKTIALLGPPRTPLDRVIRWTAHWVAAGGRLLGKPTHFDVRDGGF